MMRNLEQFSVFCRFVKQSEYFRQVSKTSPAQSIPKLSILCSKSSKGSNWVSQTSGNQVANHNQNRNQDPDPTKPNQNLNQQNQLKHKPKSNHTKPKPPPLNQQPPPARHLHPVLVSVVFLADLLPGIGPKRSRRGKDHPKKTYPP